MTTAQTDALELIRRNGRFGVGAYGGIPWPTIKVLARQGFIKVSYERSKWTGKIVAYASVK